jgi:hypothetical protein
LDTANPVGKKIIQPLAIPNLTVANGHKSMVTELDTILREAIHAAFSRVNAQIGDTISKSIWSVGTKLFFLRQAMAVGRSYET